jgi:transcription antitermination factor NusG
MSLNSWYAVQIRPTYVTLSEMGLRAKGYEIFLPTYRKCVLSGSRTITNECPLFPGYLFCRITPECNGHIVTTPGVIRIVAFGGQPAVIDEEEIVRVRTIIASDVVRDPWQYVQTGCTIQIRSGPLKGLRGILISTKQSRRIVVSVSILQRSVAAVLDSDTTISILSAPNGSLAHSDHVPCSLVRDLVTATPATE